MAKATLPTDGKMRCISLKVTQDIINKAERCRSDKCMYALAIILMGGTNVRFRNGVVSFEYAGWRYHYDIPGKADFNLQRFDYDKTLIKPHILRLDSRGATCAPTPKKKVRKTRSRRVVEPDPPKKITLGAPDIPRKTKPLTGLDAIIQNHKDEEIIRNKPQKEPFRVRRTHQRVTGMDAIIVKEAKK